MSSGAPFSSFELAGIEAAFVPVDMQAAANNGDWISLENYKSVLCVLFGAAGTAGDDPVFTLTQATANDGSGEKALTFEVIHEKVGTLASVASWTRATQSAATSYTNAASAEGQKIIMVRIDADELDVAGGFTHVQLTIPDTGSNAALGCGFYLMGNPTHSVAAASLANPKA